MSIGEFRELKVQLEADKNNKTKLKAQLEAAKRKCFSPCCIQRNWIMLKRSQDETFYFFKSKRFVWFWEELFGGLNNYIILLVGRASNEFHPFIVGSFFWKSWTTSKTSRWWFTLVDTYVRTYVWSGLHSTSASFCCEWELWHHQLPLSLFDIIDIPMTRITLWLEYIIVY